MQPGSNAFNVSAEDKQTLSCVNTKLIDGCKQTSQWSIDTVISAERHACKQTGKLKDYFIECHHSNRIIRTHLAFLCLVFWQPGKNVWLCHFTADSFFGHLSHLNSGRLRFLHRTFFWSRDSDWISSGEKHHDCIQVQKGIVQGQRSCFHWELQYRTEAVFCRCFLRWPQSGL